MQQLEQDEQRMELVEKRRISHRAKIFLSLSVLWRQNSETKNSAANELLCSVSC